MNRHGFTLIELMVALFLFAVVSAAIYQLLVGNQRVYQAQTQRVDLNANLRAAVALLPGEMRELNATDTVESDILAMSADQVELKALRGLYVVCGIDNIGGPNGSNVDLVIYPEPKFELREIDPGRDSVLVYVENAQWTRTDNYWAHADLRGVTQGTLCDDLVTAGTELQLRGVYPADLPWAWQSLDSVKVGAPLRTFELLRYETYQDVQGDWWLGMRQYTKAQGWAAAPQPLLGPLSAQGMSLIYYDVNENELDPATADPANVVRIGVQVIGRTAQPVRESGGTYSYVLDTLSADIALRNNMR